MPSEYEKGYFPDFDSLTTPGYTLGALVGSRAIAEIRGDMTTSRRGFSRERHGGLKLLIAATSVAVFAVGWAGLAHAHDPVNASVPATGGDELVQVAAAASAQPTVTSAATSTATATSTARPASTAGATGAAPPTLAPSVQSSGSVPPVPTRTPTPATPAPSSPATSPTASGAAPKPTTTPAAKKKSRGS